MLSAMPNADVLLAPLVTREAVLSSRIEGTRATIGDVLEFEAGNEIASATLRDDIDEVLNYRRAIREAERRLETLPMSQRLVRGVHAVLLAGVRGRSASPGEYRRVPNWIGAPGSTLADARYVPISPERVPDAMSAWERFVHSDYPDQLVQIAVLHAEFEAIHPFIDGNGRLGRMLIPLLLWQVGVIQRPVFYVSAYFERRREQYYDRLLGVSRDDDWTGWCHFFLEGLRAQAEDNQAKASGILKLYGELKLRIPEITRSQYAMRAVDWIFANPVFNSTAFVNSSNVPEPTARRFLSLLQAETVLTVLRPSRGRQAAILGFPALIRVVDGEASA
jgi:Fic family protein